MRCYVGKRELRQANAGGGRAAETTVAAVYVEERGTLYPLKHVVKHSPDGFEWGYGGSGPAELARCILIDATWGDFESIDRNGLYQDFKREVVAGLDRDGWRLREDRAELDTGKEG